MAVAESRYKRSAIMYLPVFSLYLLLSLPATADSLAGASLFESIQKYASFGDQRTGGEGDRATTDWLMSELKAIEFTVEPVPGGIQILP